MARIGFWTSEWPQANLQNYNYTMHWCKRPSAFFPPSCNGSWIPEYLTPTIYTASHCTVKHQSFLSDRSSLAYHIVSVQNNETVTEDDRAAGVHGESVVSLYHWRPILYSLAAARTAKHPRYARTFANNGQCQYQHRKVFIWQVSGETFAMWVRALVHMAAVPWYGRWRALHTISIS